MSETKQERIKNVLQVEPVDLPWTSEAAVVSTLTLGKYVNTMMRCLFKDYLGCDIRLELTDQNSAMFPIRCDMSFSLGSNNGGGAKIAAFTPVAQAAQKKGGARFTEMINQHNRRCTSLNAAVMTQEAVDIFHDLIWYPLACKTKDTPEAYQKSGIVRETGTPQYGNQNNQLITPIVSYIDITSVLAALLHGSPTTKNGRRYSDIMIQPVPIHPMLQQQTPDPARRLLNQWYTVTKLDQDAVNDMMNEAGIINRNNGVNCMTETF